MKLAKNVIGMITVMLKAFIRVIYSLIQLESKDVIVILRCFGQLAYK